MKGLGFYLIIFTLLVIISAIFKIGKSKDTDDIKTYLLFTMIYFIPNFLFIFNFLVNYKT